MGLAARREASVRRLARHFGEGATLALYDAKDQATVATGIRFRRFRYSAEDIAARGLGRDSFAVVIAGSELEALDVNLGGRHQLVIGGLKYAVGNVHRVDAGGGVVEYIVEAKG